MGTTINDTNYNFPGQKAIYKGSSQKWRMFEVFLNGAFDGLEHEPTVCAS